MNRFVLINKQGHYARPAKDGSYAREYTKLNYVTNLNDAYLWSVVECRHGDVRKAYARAMEQGCKKLEAHEKRQVFLGEE